MPATSRDRARGKIPGRVFDTYFGSVAMANELPELPSITLGRYRHYKGGEYEVLGVVRHSESLEPLVLYRPLYNDSGCWVRPFGMFLEPVEHEGRTRPRFSRMNIGSADADA